MKFISVCSFILPTTGPTDLDLLLYCIRGTEGGNSGQ